ncbi:O-antigen ligase family protein [Hansschlegelia plantiphila]|uniref:O-antigen ligase-related domain-containing protein n=1 Tax=Hansschlegelia plantiphila TaxID=374655 RepID=A0A9W6J115_9HYPH|nr:O-antigen ligase family protein [Hansschlegelia plantiphila]GLK68836.1 hypothetical protein GCM10008179_24740 [Hansschlegelia plantiphila]
MSDAAITAGLASAGRRPAAAVGWRGALHLGLFVAFLAYVFIGTQPLADPSAAADRVDGSPLDRFVVLGMVFLALAALAANLREAGRMALRNPGLIAVVGFCLLSVVWSDYPDLTIRRAMLLVFLTIAAAGIAVGVTDLRRFHTTLVVALTTVVILNLLVTAAAPSRAITDLGVRGIYTQKNVAGIVSMIAVVVAATWALGARRRRSVVLGLCAIVPAAAFLAISRSKTSIGLTVLALALLAVFALAEKIGARFVLAVVLLLSLALAAALLTLAAFDFDKTQLAIALFGDATFTGRDELWAFALNAAHERTWLGHGYGAFWDVGPGNDPLLRMDPGSWLGDIASGEINQAHNGYLELWLHIGLPAMIVAALVVAWGAARGVALAARRSIGRPERAAIGALALLLVLHLLHNLTEATLFMRGIAFCNVALLALLVLSRCRDIASADDLVRVRNPVPDRTLGSAR